MSDRKPTKAELVRWVQESADRRNLRTASPADIYRSWLAARRYIDQGVRIFQFRDWLEQQVEAKVLYGEPEKPPGYMTPMERALTWQDDLGYWIGAVGLMSPRRVSRNLHYSRSRR